MTGTTSHSDTARLKVGYNPYQSGFLVKKGWKKKRDMRELSKWIEIRKRVRSEDPD